MSNPQDLASELGDLKARRFAIETEMRRKQGELVREYILTYGFEQLEAAIQLVGLVLLATLRTEMQRLNVSDNIEGESELERMRRS